MGNLIIKNLTKRYNGNITVVDKVNIEINENELATIVGPSGCGKTTTLRMIAGFIVPNEGVISIDGCEVVNVENSTYLQPEKRDIGMVFQTYAVWPHMNVFDNVAYPLKLRKTEKNKLRQKTDEVLKIVDLLCLSNRYPHELSGGQQQRVALARALVMDPKLLLLDEPLSNLDAALREQMRSEIKEIQKRMKVTIVNVTHDQVEAMSMSDKVIVMNKGSLIQMGSPRQLYNEPVNSFVAKFIGSANIIPCKWLKDDSENVMTIDIYGETIQIAKKERKSDKGMIAVRPNKIDFDQSSTLKGCVARKLYLGHSIEYYLTVENEMLRVITDVVNDFDINNIIGLKIKDAVWLDE